MLLNGDFADTVGNDQEIHDLYVSSVPGPPNTAAATSASSRRHRRHDRQRRRQPTLNLIAGTAGASQFTGNSSTITITPAGAGHPVLDNVALPHTNEDIEFAAPITGAPAPGARPLRRQRQPRDPRRRHRQHVAVLGNNATDEELNEAPGIVATLVTDAQVSTPGFLDGFDVFIFTRPGGAFNATLSAAAAAQARAFTRRAVLLNGDFADTVGNDQEIQDLFVSSVRWAAEHGGGYIGELKARPPA